MFNDFIFHKSKIYSGLENEFLNCAKFVSSILNVKKFTRIQVFSSLEEAQNRVDINAGERIKVGNKTICIARNQKGFYALDDKCPHQGGSLAQGFCNNEGELICPWHHHGFNVQTGQGRGEYVDVYPLEITDEGVFVLLPQSSWNLFGDLF